MSFLSGRDRSSYLDILKPHLGYSVDFILATTYSLDLDTILMSALSLGLNYNDEIDLSSANHLALLEGCRRLSERSIILYQPGQVHRPNSYNPLYYLIEQSLYPARAPRGGVFHPKIWFLKYKSEDQQPQYRLICLSRNMTFDTSWDFSLVLQGSAQSVQSEEGRTLSSFFKELEPRLSPRHKTIYDQAVQEIKRVHFQVPQNLKISFHPLGLKESQAPFKASAYDRQCIVSPFLRSTFSKDQLASQNILISRPDEICQMNKDSQQKFKETWIINEALFEYKAVEEESLYLADDVGSDLHAKMYFLEKESNVDLFIGSANATEAAFKENVEFMVCLKGKKSDIGINQFLNTKDDFGFRTLLKPYEKIKLSDEHQQKKKFDALILKTQKALFSSRLFYDFKQIHENFQMTLYFVGNQQWKTFIKENEVDVKVNLASRPHQIISLSELNIFEEVSLGELTSLFCFSIHIAGFEQGAVYLTQKIEGPEFTQKRSDYVIQKFIGSKDKFIQFLYLILQGNDITPDATMQSTKNKIDDLLDSSFRSGSSSDTTATYLQVPLFEEILKCLARAPDKLSAIDRIVVGLENADQKVLPEGFMQLWKNIRQAKKDLHV